MNINQQAEIEELFKRVNKRIGQSSSSQVSMEFSGKGHVGCKISEDELNKVRAYVVQSQRPLQSVRLLKKEQEERITDENFTKQKEKIIKDAKKLDMEREQYRGDQRKMIEQVARDTKDLQENAAHRKQLEDKLAKEQKQIEENQTLINGKDLELNKLQHDLQDREFQLGQYKKFTNFLDSVVKDKSGESFDSITDLQNRFKSLKNENNMLIRQKRKLQYQLDEAKVSEKNKMNNLQNKLYEKQKQMQDSQQEIEDLSSKNSILEQEFENEIGKKNKTQKELGQIINSINNINNICKDQQARVRPGKVATKDEIKLSEDTRPDLAVHLATRLQYANTVVNELVHVYERYTTKYEYNIDKAYKRDIEIKHAEPNLGNTNTRNVGSRGGGGFDPGSTGGGPPNAFNADGATSNFN